MEVLLHRIEALPGEGRYALTFRRADGGEQSAVAQVGDGDVAVAEASLPEGWRRGSDEYAGTVAAVLALDAARRTAPRTASLRDVDGGWDVGLGNVVLGDGGTPVCTAHGPMEAGAAGVWTCADCGAQAVLG